MDTNFESSLKRFPVELKQNLLSLAPDIFSLRSMVLSCSSLYHAFLGAEKMITTQVVKHQFESIPEALLQHARNRAKDLRTEKDFDLFIQNNSWVQFTNSWTLAEALSLARLHTIVERFTSDFIAETLSKYSTFAYIDPPPNWPVSQDELTRIYRAFYRFELFCHPFYQHSFSSHYMDEVSWNEVMIFSFAFSCWEIEQVAALYEYLYRLICPGTIYSCVSRLVTDCFMAFNDIVEHDFKWGDDSTYPVDVILYGDEFDNRDISCLLSHGLEFIRKVVDSETYRARHDLLSPLQLNHHRCCSSEILTDWLNRYDNSIRLSEYTPDEEQEFRRIHSVFLSDPNSGPVDAWRWAHQDETMSGFFFSVNQVALRSRGYCMWDRARLDKWAVFQQPWDPPQNPHQGDEQKSQKAAMKIWFENRRRPL